MSQIPKGYKQTDVGVIPEEWEVCKIQDLIDNGFIIGHLDGNHGELYPRSDEFKSFGVPYIGATDFARQYVDFNSCKFLSAERARSFKKGIARNGDVLFAHNATVGPVAFLKTYFDYVILSTTATYFRCDTQKLNNVFMSYVLQSPSFIKQYQAVMSQSTRNQVPITAQRKLIVTMPTRMIEQEAIAGVLSDVDALISALGQLIDKKQNLKLAAMQHLLTPKQGWEVKKLGEIANIKTGSKNNQDKIADGIYPFFVRSATVERINSYSYDCEAILVPGEGNIGSIFHYINGCFDAHQRVYVIRDFAEHIDGKFVYLYMLKNFGAHAMQNSVKATVDSLRLPTFLEFDVWLPKTKTEQTRIAAILSDMDEEISALESKLSKYRQIKEAMMQKLLTGKVRLV